MHQLHAAVQTLVQQGTIHIQTNLNTLGHVLTHRHERRKRATRHLENLQGANDATLILHTRSRLRVNLRQAGVQNPDTLGACLLLEALAHPRIRAGELQLIQGGAHVQARTAHQNRVAATAANLLNQLTATLLKLRYGGLVPHVHDVQQVVRNTAHLLRGDLRGTNIHTPVELHRISVNALTVQAQSQLNGERALTGAGRAHNSDNGQSFGDSHAPHSTGSLTPTCGGGASPKNGAHDSL